MREEENESKEFLVQAKLLVSRIPIDTKDITRFEYQAYGSTICHALSIKLDDEKDITITVYEKRKNH